MKRNRVVFSFRLDPADIERARAFNVCLAEPVRQFIRAYLNEYASLQKQKGVILCKRTTREN